MGGHPTAELREPHRRARVQGSQRPGHGPEGGRQPRRPQMAVSSFSFVSFFVFSWVGLGKNWPDGWFLSFSWDLCPESEKAFEAPFHWLHPASCEGLHAMMDTSLLVLTLILASQQRRGIV